LCLVITALTDERDTIALGQALDRLLHSYSAKTVSELAFRDAWIFPPPLCSELNDLRNAYERHGVVRFAQSPHEPHLLVVELVEALGAHTLGTWLSSEHSPALSTNAAELLSLAYRTDKARVMMIRTDLNTMAHLSPTARILERVFEILGESEELL
jgi:hypothetical protein